MGRAAARAWLARPLPPRIPALQASSSSHPFCILTPPPTYPPTVAIFLKGRTYCRHVVKTQSNNKRGSCVLLLHPSVLRPPPAPLAPTRLVWQARPSREGLPIPHGRHGDLSSLPTQNRSPTAWLLLSSTSPSFILCHFRFYVLK